MRLGKVFVYLGAQLKAGYFLQAFLFAGMVEYRSAFLKRRMTDLNCYLRASWAVRLGGQELYNVWDDNNWHYRIPTADEVARSKVELGVGA